MLDVQMPGLTGFEVARRLLHATPIRTVVFVTAYDQHAIEAFEVNAVDYLLKPVEADRLGRRSSASAGVCSRTARAGPTPATSSVSSSCWGSARTGREQLAVKVGDRFLLIQAEEVVARSVEDDVITVVTNSLSGTSNYRTLDELQARLDPGGLLAGPPVASGEHQQDQEIVPWFSRNYILKMKDAKGSEIPVSRSQTRRLREYLKL